MNESLQEIIRIEIWTFSFQICFGNKFWTLGSGQTENTQIRVFVYFPFDHFPKAKIDSESRFEMRMSIFLFEAFWSIFKKKSKNVFPVVFLVSDLTGVGYIF